MRALSLSAGARGVATRRGGFRRAGPSRHPAPSELPTSGQGSARDQARTPPASRKDSELCRPWAGRAQLASWPSKRAVSESSLPVGDSRGAAAALFRLGQCTDTCSAAAAASDESALAAFSSAEPLAGGNVISTSSSGF